jgi:hypothetical protein
VILKTNEKRKQLEGEAEHHWKWFEVNKNNYSLFLGNFLPELLPCLLENVLLISGYKFLKKAKEVVCLEQRFYMGEYDKM